MSLIIVEKKRDINGQYYHFTDFHSHMQKRWTPPKGYSKADIRHTIEMIGATMEMENNANENSMSSSNIFPNTPSKEMLFEDFISNVFMPRKSEVISENTRASWQSLFNHHLFPFFGFYKISEITSCHVADYLIYAKQLGLKNTTVNKHYTVLQNVFKMMYSMNLIDESPMKRVERPRSYKKDISDPVPSAYTPQEVAYILECMESEPIKYQVMIRIMCETGIRRGECCALTWDCIHFDTGAIDIVGNLCYTHEKGVYMDTPKNGKRNTVFVSPKTIEMLHELYILNLCTYDSKYLFTKRRSAEPIHPQTPNKYFLKFGKRYGIEHMHPHKLRHTFASIAISNGADAVSVAKLLGHSSVEVLFRYYVSTDLEAAKKASMVFQSAISEAQQNLV